jgi:hypothetical protein
LVVAIRQPSDRSKAVDSGATRTIKAMRAKKNICNPSQATTSNISQRMKG